MYSLSGLRFNEVSYSIKLILILNSFSIKLKLILDTYYYILCALHCADALVWTGVATHFHLNYRVRRSLQLRHT